MEIKSIQELRNFYSTPKGRVKIKVLPSLETHSKHFIQKSPFLVMSTYSKSGMDSSPRGGAPGFVKVLNEMQIAIPDAKGNNRLDSLENILETGKVGLLFFLPGIDETLRINGSAKIVTDDDLIDLFKDEKNRPASALVVTIDEMFMHCAKALMRSKIWDSSTYTKREDFPSMGKILKDQLGGDSPVESHEEMVKRYLPDL